MRSHATISLYVSLKILGSFNTASGMRSHVTTISQSTESSNSRFQYRKRYEVTCDENAIMKIQFTLEGFNTASGMRSHVTDSLIVREMTESEVSIPQAV